jgi:hypothetical protein
VDEATPLLTLRLSPNLLPSQYRPSLGWTHEKENQYDIRYSYTFNRHLYQTQAVP